MTHPKQTFHKHLVRTEIGSSMKQRQQTASTASLTASLSQPHDPPECPSRADPVENGILLCVVVWLLFCADDASIASWPMSPAPREAERAARLGLDDQLLQHWESCSVHTVTLGSSFVGNESNNFEALSHRRCWCRCMQRALCCSMPSVTVAVRYCRNRDNSSFALKKGDVSKNRVVTS